MTRAPWDHPPLRETVGDLAAVVVDLLQAVQAANDRARALRVAIQANIQGEADRAAEMIAFVGKDLDDSDLALSVTAARLQDTLRRFAGEPDGRA